MKFSALLLVGFSACLFGLAGCETVNDSSGENFNRTVHAEDTDLKLFPMDLERVLLIYKPSELAAEPIPVR